tara:strand:- start:474 stop:752 length:279 start_codon:yes stop_codon:yes gene_type:complete
MNKDRPLNKPFKSDVKGKKYSVIVMKDGKRKKINFGAKGSPDFRGTDGNKASVEQRKSFRARMMGVKKAGAPDGLAYKDKTSPAYWALRFLW